MIKARGLIQWHSLATRLGLYAALCACFGMLAIGFLMLKPGFNFVVSDARGYYVYLPSAIIDGDLDFRNQIIAHWDVDFSPDLLHPLTSTGLVADKYPIGLALSLAPGFLAAHAMAYVFGYATDGYAAPYQLAALFSVLGFAWLTACLWDSWLTSRWHLRPKMAFAAIVGFWLATPQLYYLIREPLMVHTVSLFWVSLCVVILNRDERLPLSIPVGFLFGLAAAMAIVCRPTNALILAPFILVSSRKWLRPSIVGFALLGAIGPLAAQALTWHTLFGQWLYFSYEGEGFRWANPQLAATLFSTKHGLFTWTPNLVFAAIGVALFGFMRPRGYDRRWFAAAVSASLLLWYANASWWCWWFGDAFGARAFIELGPIIVWSFAQLLAIAVQWPKSWRMMAIGLFSVGFLWQSALFALYVTHRIPRADYLWP